MKLSYNWLKAYVALDKATDDGTYPSPEMIAQRLDESGIAVEGISYLTQEDGLSKDDVIIDINIPREFSSYAGMMWTANEICGLFHVSFEECQTYGNLLPDDTWDRDMIEVTDLYLNSTTSKCTMLAGRIINHVEALESPSFIKDAIIANGYNPVNTLIDIPIYVARNLGQPCYFIDFDKLESKEILMEEAVDSGSITYQGEKYDFSKGDVIATCGGKTIGIFGVIFDDSVMVDSNTKSLVILTTYMDSEIIGQFKDKFGLNNLNIQLMDLGCNVPTQMKSIQNATCLLYEFSKASMIETVDIFTKHDTIKTILGTTMKEINEFLSTNLTYSELVSVVVNGNMTAFVKDIVYHNGEKVDIPICTGSPYVSETNRIGSKFGSYRNRREPCDLAQCLICYLGCDRIGERDLV